MTVYVDPLHSFVKVLSKAVISKRGPMWSNLASDTDDLKDLHDLADKIGLQRAWFRYQNAVPVYYVTPEMRLRAVENGAQEISTAELIQKCSKLLRIR